MRTGRWKNAKLNANASDCQTKRANANAIATGSGAARVETRATVCRRAARSRRDAHRRRSPSFASDASAQCATACLDARAAHRCVSDGASIATRLFKQLIEKLKYLHFNTA